MEPPICTLFKVKPNSRIAIHTKMPSRPCWRGNSSALLYAPNLGNVGVICGGMCDNIKQLYENPSQYVFDQNKNYRSV
jgi:hypothetical protein